MKTYVVTPHLNRLNEMVLLMGHNLCFKEYGKLSLNYLFYPSYLEHCLKQAIQK